MAKAFLRMLRSSFSADSLSQREQVALPPWARDAYRCSVANGCQWMLCRRALYTKWAQQRADAVLFAVPHPRLGSPLGQAPSESAVLFAFPQVQQRDSAVLFAFPPDRRPRGDPRPRGQRKCCTLRISRERESTAKGTPRTSTSQAPSGGPEASQRKCCTPCMSHLATLNAF